MDFFLCLGIIALLCLVFFSSFDEFLFTNGKFFMTLRSFCFSDSVMAHIFFIILSSLCFFYCYFIESTHAAEDFITVLTQGQTLRDGQVLVSPKGTFTLGFFANDGSPYSESRYLGIKLNTSVVFNLVWVANRDNPISDSNAFLSLDANGILRIERQGINITILNSNLAASPTSNLTATLLDSGNFVLKEINNAAATTERLLWQSFDYPIDTLLPGMKLSVSNSNSGRNRSLTSWLSDRILSRGAFTLGLDPNADQLLIQRRGETYWRSGDWDGRQQFRFVPDLTDPKKYFDPAFFRVTVNFIYVSDKDERYFTYNYSHVDYPILIWVLNSMGTLRTSGIVGQNAVSKYQMVIECQANGAGSGGCEEQKLPSCRTGFEQFQQRRGSMEMEGPPSFGPVYGSDSLSDCEIRCRRNCSCIAYAIYDIQDQVGCKFWFKGSRFVEDSGSNFIYVLSSALDGNKLRSWLWLIILGSFVSALLVLVFLWFFWCRKGKRQANEEDVLLEFGRLSPSHEHGKGVSAQFQLFTYHSMVSATNNFSPKNKLGEGGFGPVYKGKLEEEQEIAVKKLSKSSGQGLNEFKNEIALIAKLQHMNLVRLLGFCTKGEEKMLVYEYMPNKSLDSFLFDPAGRQLLDWKKRINIIEGIAQGLIYLHKYSRLRIIHRDLKASNILLDAEMNPKISDFGMAKIFGHGESTANTNRIVGTYGYMSPEYAMEGIFSVKSDVFSYGVLVLEIVSGRRNTSFYDSDHHVNLIGYAWDLWQKRAVMELVDVTLLSSASSEEILLRCVHVGLLCVQESAEDRPTMLDVVSMLSNETLSLPQPKQPAFSVVRNIAMEENPKGKSQLLSQNGLTMSMVRAR